MYKELNEPELASKCREGDSLAADELYRRYAARLLTLCRRYSSSLEDAEDLMQEAVLKALDKMPSFSYRGEGSLYAWLSRIAINMALNNVRKARNQILASEPVPDNIPEPTAEEVAGIPQERLLEMIASLPEGRRTVFNLYCLDGYSHNEIGKMLGINPKASASELAKARIQLKKAINDELGKHN